MTTSEARPREALQFEQAYVDDVYARLDELRQQARTRLAQVRREGPSGSPQNRSERDAFATMYEDRIATLEAVEDRLVFGRLDLHDGERRYVGRIGLSDSEHAPILTDWRAPAAQAFYQATAHTPGEVTLRRHLQTKDRRVISVEDDVLDLDALSPQAQVELSGEGALLAALNASRTGRMGDIVATIQAEQDAIIRSDLDGVLVVQGGPGTGKTAVALHRAAYLLYSHRKRLARSGVLVLGPSRVFLRYIEQVLPSLGETGVVSSTINDLVPGVQATAEDAAEVARIKGRSEWARIIARAVRNKQRVLPEQNLNVDGVTLTLRPEDVREAQARARRSGLPHNRARVTFVRTMLTTLANQYLKEIGDTWEDPAHVVEEIRSARDVRVALNLCWLPLSATGLVAELFAKPHKLAAAAPRMSARDRESVRRETGAPWTTSDIPLIDEAAELIGSDDEQERTQAKLDAAQRERGIAYAQELLDSGDVGGGMVSAEMLADRFADFGPQLSMAERAYRDRSWTYGHIVVDEAQELSPMAWRALLRRCPSRSMTVVGDVAQTSSAAGTRSWADTLDPLLRSNWREAVLSVNYRTPLSVMAAARAAATAVDPEHPPAPLESAREVLDALMLTEADDLADGVRSALDAELALAGDGTIAVVAASDRVSALAAALGIPAGAADLSAQVVLLDPAGTKGLEFDRVILAEPNEIIATGSASGVRAAAADLYVAMTRPTQRLHVVAASGLPAPLRDALNPGTDANHDRGSTE